MDIDCKMQQKCSLATSGQLHLFSPFVQNCPTPRHVQTPKTVTFLYSSCRFIYSLFNRHIIKLLVSLPGNLALQKTMTFSTKSRFLNKVYRTLLFIFIEHLVWIPEAIKITAEWYSFSYNTSTNHFGLCSSASIMRESFMKRKLVAERKSAEDD